MLEGKKVSAIILGAGASRRMEGCDKLFAHAFGKPLLYWSICAFEHTPLVDEIIIVLNQANLTAGRKLTEKEKFYRVRAIVPGGERRQDSVMEGLKSATGEIVLIHDGARPLVDSSLIERVARGALLTGACIPAIIPTDTIKTELDGFVKETLPRKALRAIQTPQAFESRLLQSAFRNADCEVTDDAQMAEMAGIKVSLTDGSYDNIKVTTPSDLELARILIRKRGGTK